MLNNQARSFCLYINRIRLCQKKNNGSGIWNHIQIQNGYNLDFFVIIKISTRVYINISIKKFQFQTTFKIPSIAFMIVIELHNGFNIVTKQHYVNHNALQTYKKYIFVEFNSIELKITIKLRQTQYKQTSSIIQLIASPFRYDFND